MFTQLNQKAQAEIRHIRHRVKILKIKWCLLFVLPILLIVVAYHVSKQFLKIRMRELGNKLTQNGNSDDTDKQSET